MVNKAWRIIPRPLLETILNNHAQHHRVPQPLILHGPRGVGKTTLILDRLLDKWNTGPHITGYVDFAQSIEDHHPHHGNSFPWTSWSNCPPPALPTLRTQLEHCLESMAQKAVQLGTISSHQIFTTLNKWHGLNTALRRVLQSNALSRSTSKTAVSEKASSLVLWSRALFALSARSNVKEIDGVLGLSDKGKSVSVEEASYFREAIVALKLAKEVIRIQQGWRANAVKDLNRVGGFSRSLANSATDWPCLLLELLSSAAETDYFQPKLVINNIEVLKHAVLTDDSTVSGSLYHDCLIWRIIALGANERCLPIILVTSDGYYSYRAFMDFGFPDIFISRETFGWTPQEAKMHMVADYYSQSEWNVVVEVLGPSPRHLFELYALKQSNFYQKVMDDKASTFEDIVDAYLAFLQLSNAEATSTQLCLQLRLRPSSLTSTQRLPSSSTSTQRSPSSSTSTHGIGDQQACIIYFRPLQISHTKQLVTVVNPAMDKALSLLQRFANDARNGKISKDWLRFGAPWRHPPRTDNPALCLEWAKLQLMDFIQSLVNAEFGVNYLADCSLEILDDPSAIALLEVGLLYAQRDPSFLRPVSQGIQRCLVRWLVKERMQMRFPNSLQYLWQRIIRGRSYRHLMLQVGYDK